MSDPAPAPPENPPLVLRVEPPRRVHPGLAEAVFWSVAFLFGQLAGAAVFALAVLGVYALGAENPGQFLNAQVDGLAKAASASAPAGERPPAPREMASALAWGMFGAQVVSLGVIALVLPRRIGPDWKRQIGLRRPPWVHVLLVVLILPGFVICATGLEHVVTNALNAKPLPGAEALKGVFAPWPGWLVVLTVGVGPGVVEELWCRGFLGRGLSARYGLAAGVLVTSVLFAALHLHPKYVPVYALMGAYLHFTYLASRSIWVPVLLHALNNAVAVLMAMNGVLMQLQGGPGSILPVIFLAAFSLLLFGSVALWTGRVELRGPKLKDPTFVPEYPGISAPPPGSEDRLGRAETSPAAFTMTLLSLGALAYLLTRPG
jgi:membrane protease YdiL (CAAX protease family)